MSLHISLFHPVELCGTQSEFLVLPKREKEAVLIQPSSLVIKHNVNIANHSGFYSAAPLNTSLSLAHIPLTLSESDLYLGRSAQIPK